MVAKLQFSKPIIPSAFVSWHSTVKSFLLSVVYLSIYMWIHYQHRLTDSHFEGWIIIQPPSLALHTPWSSNSPALSDRWEPFKRLLSPNVPLDGVLHLSCIRRLQGAWELLKIIPIRLHACVFCNGWRSNSVRQILQGTVASPKRQRDSGTETWVDLSMCPSHLQLTNKNTFCIQWWFWSPLSLLISQPFFPSSARSQQDGRRRLCRVTGEFPELTGKTRGRQSLCMLMSRGLHCWDLAMTLMMAVVRLAVLWCAQLTWFSPQAWVWTNITPHFTQEETEALSSFAQSPTACKWPNGPWTQIHHFQLPKPQPHPHWQAPFNQGRVQLEALRKEPW